MKNKDCAAIAGGIPGSNDAIGRQSKVQRIRTGVPDGLPSALKPSPQRTSGLFSPKDISMNFPFRRSIADRKGITHTSLAHSSFWSATTFVAAESPSLLDRLSDRDSPDRLYDYSVHPPRCAFGFAAPKGGVFCLGAARRQKTPSQAGTPGTCRSGAGAARRWRLCRLEEIFRCPESARALPDRAGRTRQHGRPRIGHRYAAAA